jgi:hypothetical protein
MFSAVLAVLRRPLRPLLILRQVPSCTNLRYVFITVRLVGAGRLPQRSAHRLRTSQALFTLAYSKQIQTLWFFVKRGIFILAKERRDRPRFFLAHYNLIPQGHECLSKQSKQPYTLMHSQNSYNKNTSTYDKLVAVVKISLIGRFCQFTYFETQISRLKLY